MMKLCHHIKILFVTILFLLSQFSFLCRDSLAEEKYAAVDLRVVVVMEGCVSLYLDSDEFKETTWFPVPHGKDDNVLTLVMSSLVMDSELFITYDDKTMEMLSIGIRRDVE